jgi:ParB-like partition proteins
VSKRGLPTGVGLRHDSHYVEELTRTNRAVGRILPIDKIEPNPEQPRTEIGDLTELTNSIREKGVLEPLLVKPNRETGTWMIIAGERRWRASNLAGLREVPCIELDLDERGIAEIALIENLQRKDLTVWEEADGLAALASRFGYTHDEIAKKIGKSRTTVTEALTIAGLPEKIRQKCVDAKITAKSVLLEIARQFDEAAMSDFIDTIQSKKLSREEIRRTVRPTAVKTPKIKESSVARTTSKEKPENSLNSFRYESQNGDFNLEIRFKDGSCEKTRIIEALEETLERLKIS